MFAFLGSFFPGWLDDLGVGIGSLVDGVGCTGPLVRPQYSFLSWVVGFGRGTNECKSGIFFAPLVFVLIFLRRTSANI